MRNSRDFFLPQITTMTHFKMPITASVIPVKNTQTSVKNKFLLFLKRAESFLLDT